MATYTTNYNLEKPEASDPFGDFRESYNDNLDIIDANLGGGGGSSSLAGLSDVNLVTPTDGQILTYDGNSSKWVNANGGSGGHVIVDPNGSSMPTESKLQFTGNVSVSDDSVNGKTIVDVEGVSDVKVNGVSVVDLNNEAQITSYKEVTQAQYDALPNTKLTDGIAYFIKDGTSPTYDNEYSTTEKVVGTWTNSKPVYQLTVELSTFTIPTSGSAWWNLKTDVAKLIGYFGGYTCLGNQFMFGEVIYNDGNTSDILKTTVSLYQNSNNTVAVKFTQKISSVNPQTATNLFITIRYTKTTD